jgi:voltage-dependent potassium channel beta subunit
MQESSMEYRRLGSAGVQVSALSFGAWVTFGSQYGVDTAYECMDSAHRAGVNFFDNAEAYAGGEAEVIMGEALRRAGWKRSDLMLSTKIFWGGRGPNDSGLSRKHVIEGTDAALKRMGLDYVDLIFCHRPDPYTPIEETVWAMSHVVTSGRAFYWGTSEWSAEQIREAYWIARREHLVPPTMEQPQYNMFYRERVELEYAALYHDIGLGTTIWSPLASGLLTGKYSEGIPAGTRATLEGYEWLKRGFESDEARERIEKVRRLAPIAKDLDCTLAQLAIAWCLTNPHVSTVITGASRPEQVVENMQAMGVVERLTPDVLERIEEVLQNKPKPPRPWR